MMHHHLHNHLAYATSIPLTTCYAPQTTHARIYRLPPGCTTGPAVPLAARIYTPDVSATPKHASMRVRCAADHAGTRIMHGWYLEDHFVYIVAQHLCISSCCYKTPPRPINAEDNTVLQEQDGAVFVQDDLDALLQVGCQVATIIWQWTFQTGISGGYPETLLCIPHRCYPWTFDNHWCTIHHAPTCSR